jgi:4-hydroxybenzoate polyprenyltransferase
LVTLAAVSDDDPTPPAFDRRKIRMGLGMIVVVVVLAIGMAFAVPNPVLKVFFGGLIVVAVLQLWRLRRVVRGEQTS